MCRCTIKACTSTYWQDTIEFRSMEAVSAGSLCLLYLYTTECDTPVLHFTRDSVWNFYCRFPESRVLFIAAKCWYRYILETNFHAFEHIIDIQDLVPFVFFWFSITINLFHMLGAGFHNCCAKLNWWFHRVFENW